MSTLETARLLLRPLRTDDLIAFAALNAHPAVAEALGSTPTRLESDAMAERYGAEMRREGWGLWALEVKGGAPFVGLCGLHHVPDDLPCAGSVEIGWRLHPDHWGHGYATEAARESLRHGFEAAGLDEIVSFTTTMNVRSQAVMQRIGLHHRADDDFDHPRFDTASPYCRHVLYRLARAEWPAAAGGPSVPVQPNTPLGR